MDSTPELVPEAERSVVTRATGPILMEVLGRKYTKEQLDGIADIIKQPDSPHHLPPGELCDRPRCSRCLGQVFCEGYLKFQGAKLLVASVEEATNSAQHAASTIIDFYRHIAKHKALINGCLRALDRRQLECVIDYAFPDLPRDADQLSWNNVVLVKGKVIEGLPFVPLTRDRLLEHPEVLQDLIAKHGSLHPANFVRQIEVNIDFPWSKGACRMVSAACFVDLTEARFGEVSLPTRNGLHREGMYTFMKGFAVMQQQALLYLGLRKVSAGLWTILPELLQLHWEDAVIPPMGSPPALHEALQDALEALKPASAALEDLIIASMSSGEALENEYKNRLSWGGWSFANDEHVNEDFSRRETWHIVTAERLAHLSLLFALERDISKCRTTARSCFRKRASKTALLRDWESLELAVVRCLEYFGKALFKSARPGSTGAFSHKGVVFDQTTDNCGRVSIAPHHQLSWVISVFTNPNVHLKNRIDLLFRYLDDRSDARSLFHKQVGFVFPALTALRKAIDAMNILQPVSMREYGHELGYSYPEYGGDVVKQDSIVSTYLADVPRRGFDESTWEKFRLDKSGAMRRQHKEAWSAVFEFVEQEWRQKGMEAAILSRLLDLRTTKPMAPAKNGTPKGAQKPRLPSSILKQIQEIQLEATPQKIVALTEQEALPPNAPFTEVDKAPALMKPTRATPASAKLTLFSEMEKAFSEFEFVDKPPKLSMFPEEITWAEKQERRTRNEASRDTFSLEENRDVWDTAGAPEPNERASRIVFADAKLYKSWRIIFPLHSEGNDGGRLRWEEFCSLLMSPPLNFYIAADGGATLRFHRDQCDGWPEGVVTVHKVHGANPKMTRFELDNVKKDLRKEFGWTADDFELEA